MPISVASSFASAGLVPKGRVRWEEEFSERAPGVYVLSLTPDWDSVSPTLVTAPIDVVQLDRLVAARPYVRVDGSPADSALLGRRIGCFWLPKEPILYIGQTKKPLRSRVGDFYKHSIGDRSPHAGGWWVKALSCLPDVYVHYVPTNDFEACERVMLRHFVANAEVPSVAAGAQRHDGMPFANKEWWTEAGQRIRRNHGIGYATRDPRGALT